MLYKTHSEVNAMKNKSTLYQLTACALMAALMCVLGPMSVPIGPIPVTLTNLVIYLTVWLLGMKGASISTIVYLLLGAIGMPVFSGFQGGLAKLAGPTGGYLIGFIFIPLIAGFLMERFHSNFTAAILGMIAGTAVLYLLGTVWFVLQTKSEIQYALTVCVFPFIPFDLGKIVLASLFGKIIRKALQKSGLLPA